MAQKWLVGYSTKNPQQAFKTKREACNWALENLIGVFIVWKAEVGTWRPPNQKLNSWLRETKMLEGQP
jgi:hypothetical protein